MRYYWELAKHFLRANSRHGTHSPFVYRLADKVIYAKAGDSAGRVILPPVFPVRYRQLMHDLLVAMNIEMLETFSGQVGSAAIWVPLNAGALHELLEQVAGGTVVIVHEPYRARRKWRALIADPTIIVSIDLFHFGILMTRAAQRKENFELRYPYWR
ncbi:hypothetical protein PQ465_17175 [Sphingobacterium oryzagri]|uniref:Uncharacterized protein n=1 Tax=Sphingobacterium oryzagri TaxID=3025669 RepID=A0ABY7WEE2_9SPHI|nr:hypothetical protein [Sphingobacterium sp. KACC 22765]WDF68016.1 hypothetical protein PQ465_17175 [Sphingobacterium sp. KACC 22765]